MNKLSEIIACKRQEVVEQKSLYPVRLLEKSPFFNTTPVSLKHYLSRSDKSGIIAEFKRKSPSCGWINQTASVEQVSIGYMQAGAAALSVLTDQPFFGGSRQDLTIARKFNYCPILRKDFIVDEYQIIESRSIGADAILLIAAVLDPASLRAFTSLALGLGMEVLVEIHEAPEIERSITSGTSLVGVNNRDLKSLEVNLETSFRLADLLPKEMLKISESGIHTPQDMQALSACGYSGFLIGESFMRSSKPENACKIFIDSLYSSDNMSNRVADASTTS